MTDQNKYWLVHMFPEPQEGGGYILSGLFRSLDSAKEAAILRLREHGLTRTDFSWAKNDYGEGKWLYTDADGWVIVAVYSREVVDD